MIFTFDISSICCSIVVLSLSLCLGATFMLSPLDAFSCLSIATAITSLSLFLLISLATAGSVLSSISQSSLLLLKLMASWGVELLLESCPVSVRLSDVSLKSGVVQTLESVSYPLVEDFRDEFLTGDLSHGMELKLLMPSRSLRRSSKLS